VAKKIKQLFLNKVLKIALFTIELAQQTLYSIVKEYPEFF